VGDERRRSDRERRQDYGGPATPVSCLYRGPCLIRFFDILGRRGNFHLPQPGSRSPRSIREWFGSDGGFPHAGERRNVPSLSSCFPSRFGVRFVRIWFQFGRFSLGSFQERPRLRRLEFVDVATAQAYAAVCIVALYALNREHAGRLRPSVDAVDSAVYGVVGLRLFCDRVQGRVDQLVWSPSFRAVLLQRGCLTS
jgi:hypothetical protein